MREGRDEADVETQMARRPPRSTGVLVLLGSYWLGLTAMWVGLGQLLAGRLEFEHLVAPGTEGASLLQITAAGTLLAAGLQPAIGTVSDHAGSRFGRRLPFIVAGSLADIVFLAGVALSSSVLSIAGFFLALQVSSNIAQAPYQGYVPDLVHRDQVGTASGIVGVMVILGNVVGFAVGAAGIASGQYVAAALALGLVELATVALLVVGVREPPAEAASRGGRGWLAVARSAWGRDVLRRPGFVAAVGVRFALLTASATLVALAPFYLSRVFDMGPQTVGPVLLSLVACVGVGTLVATLPAARVSDRVGRRPVIWVACGLGGLGLLTCALAPTVPIAFAGAVGFGLAGGAFLAVDWAQISELVPRDAAGRFMGIANIATVTAALAATAVGGMVMDIIGGPSRAASGPRAALLFGVACFAVGALLLTRVPETRRAA
jgi:MFS family permease